MGANVSSGYEKTDATLKNKIRWWSHNIKTVLDNHMTNMEAMYLRVESCDCPFTSCLKHKQCYEIVHDAMYDKYETQIIDKYDFKQAYMNGMEWEEITSDIERQTHAKINVEYETCDDKFCRVAKCPLKLSREFGLGETAFYSDKKGFYSFFQFVYQLYVLLDTGIKKVKK